jgi:glycine/D-amino acid oxidase-like deaminating enzyme/thioredoxin reductase/Fe-S-cluster-containing hydrogenase component 2
MYRIDKHPILSVTRKEAVRFSFEGKEIFGEKGFTIAAALHQAGYPVHSHSLHNRSRSLECGIGKCGACEMLVDGQIKRICITNVDNISEVQEIPKNYKPTGNGCRNTHINKIYRTTVAIIGAGPAGLAARDELNRQGISNIVIDNNPKVGGQFLMQTHQFFFFENELKFGGMRGFDIANTLAGDDHTGIFLDSTVWDILEGKRLAVKNIKTGEIYYVDTQHLVVATGAVPYMPAFENDDLPGVFTAAVVQKMMNIEFTLLGKNVLTVGAGNIGYLTSYQLVQAGANVKAIIEAMPAEGGFPVQANRVKRLGIPVILNHVLLKAIPNKHNDGITGAVVAESRNFEPLPGTEKIIEGIDAINICTGLVPDDSLLIKGKEVFGRQCYGVGDALRIGEGTSAVLRGRQVAYEILEETGRSYEYGKYLQISKEYLDSQQHPVKVQAEPFLPERQRRTSRPFVILDCLHGFACNPCQFACKQGAIQKSSTSTIPTIDYDKCTGCMDCVYQCPGLAIFGYNLKTNKLFLPVEYHVDEAKDVYLVDNDGKKLGAGVIEKVLKKPNKTDLVRVRSSDLSGDGLMNVRGFILKGKYPEPFQLSPEKREIGSEKFICHCDDVKLDEVLDVIGTRKYISVDEVKHITRLGMGACRGKRCIKRLKQTLKTYGISLVGEATPRGPMSNQVSMGELYPPKEKDLEIPWIIGSISRKQKVGILIAGGGIAGSALFRYLAEAGEKPVMINSGHGATWRNIAGGRPTFSIPELSEIASQNLSIFSHLHSIKNISFHPTQYVTFAHDEKMYRALEESMQWSEAEMIVPEKFRTSISPCINKGIDKYIAALITKNCWQASPGKTVDLIRTIGVQSGGEIIEDCRLVNIKKEGNAYHAVAQKNGSELIEFEVDTFINALGTEGEKFAQQLHLFPGLYSVKHQAFITRRLPMMGLNGNPLPMLIDRRDYKGFTAVYGQQLFETGQIIGCASPSNDPAEAGKSLLVNSQEFMEIISEVFINWIPDLASVDYQAVWAGHYIEPRMVIDPEHGLFLGLRGQGFMLGQYLAKLYVQKLLGKPVPEYFERLKLAGDGLPEKSFK